MPGKIIPDAIEAPFCERDNLLSVPHQHICVESMRIAVEVRPDRLIGPIA